MCLSILGLFTWQNFILSGYISFSYIVFFIEKNNFSSYFQIDFLRKFIGELLL